MKFIKGNEALEFVDKFSKERGQYGRRRRSRKASKSGSKNQDAHVGFS